MWKEYDLELRVARLTAGIPANPKLLQAWLETNEAPAEAIVDQKAMVARLDPEETHAVVFYRDETGRPCYEGRNMKAALKEGANILKSSLNVKNFRSKLAERVFVHPQLIPLCEVKEIPDFVRRDERPISVMTMQGPRTSIKRFEYVEDVTLQFLVKVLDDDVVTEAQLVTILEYLQEGGIGADRSQGSGTFELIHFGPHIEKVAPVQRLTDVHKLKSANVTNRRKPVGAGRR